MFLLLSLWGCDHDSEPTDDTEPPFTYCFQEGEFVYRDEVCCGDLAALPLGYELGEPQDPNLPEGCTQDVLNPPTGNPSVCAPCGDGVCQTIEAYCNCPEDCARP